MNKFEFHLYRIAKAVQMSLSNLSFDIRYGYYKWKYKGAKNIPGNIVGSLLLLDDPENDWEGELRIVIAINAVASALGVYIQDLNVHSLYMGGVKNKLTEPEHLELYFNFNETNDPVENVLLMAVKLEDIPEDYKQYHWYVDFEKWRTTAVGSNFDFYQPYKE